MYGEDFCRVKYQLYQTVLFYFVSERSGLDDNSQPQAVVGGKRFCQVAMFSPGTLVSVTDMDTRLHLPLKIDMLQIL